MSKLEFNKHNVKVWMVANYFDHLDRKTNEINYTSLAETAAEIFNQNFEDGPLDDPDHWIWECATSLFENKK